MKKLFFLSFILFFFSISGFAQYSSEKISYTLLKDNPNDIPKLSISFVPIVMGLDGVTFMNYRVGLDIDYQMTEKIRLRSVNSYEIYNFETSFSGEGLSIYNYSLPVIKGTYFFDLGFSFEISDEKRKEDINVTLSSSSSTSGNVTTTNVNYTMVEGTVRKIKSIRGGFLINTKATRNYTDSLYTTDGNVYSYGEVKYANTDNPININASPIFINSSFMGGYIGFETTKILNLLVDVEDFGLRGSIIKKTTFIDLIIGNPELGAFKHFAPDYTAIDGVEMSDILVDYIPDIEKSGLKKNMFGFRIGARYSSPSFSKKNKWTEGYKKSSKLVYAGYNWELGMLPAYGYLNGLYFKMGISLDINPF